MTHQVWLTAGSFSVEAVNVGQEGSPDWHVALWRHAEKMGDSTASFPLTCDEARALGIALLIAAAHGHEEDRS
ncbi:hypothetical protein [Burkholderia ubonensis]|uniref:hypothetical protein n=1 Tax=Burkholderia ubonensis TaxID=101571 RepID=UPI000A621AE1|nr:hypothetical protein [Burkholderia ubonensis]